MSAVEKDGENLKRRSKTPLATAIVTVALLLAVAATVTHNPVHAAPPQLVVTQGDLISSTPDPTPTSAPVTAPATSTKAIVQTKVAPQITNLPPIKAIDGYKAIGFDRLAAFPIRTKWELTDPIRIKGEQKIIGDIPDAIKALNQNKVAVQGFMLPLKMTDGLVSDFFLLRTQAKCCYGLPIQVNEVLSVHMTGTGVKSLMDQPVTVYGTFHLAETRDSSTGTLDAIYSLEGEKLATPTP